MPMMELTITQDNRNVISQVIVAENDCDENTFTDSHDNQADCTNDSELNNDVGTLEQENSVDAFDNSISDQDNNVAISQELLADNDCNGTGGNLVICFNDGDFDFNSVDFIEQSNGADLFGDVSSTQINDIAVGQSGALVNTCDETGGGVNQAECRSDEIQSLVGLISQFNGVEAPNSDTVAQSNGAQVTQNLEAVNDCDEEGTGFNLADCENIAHNFVDTVDQTNDASAGDDLVQSNFVGITQDLQTENICDETGLGDNNAICGNVAENLIGPVGQINNADGSGDADFTQNNNLPVINQVIVAENDCDQSDAQSAEGDSFADCDNDDIRNFIDSITQTNGAEGTHVDDIFQDNTGAFSQVLTLNNGCDATTFSSSGDNLAICGYDNAQNLIGPVAQTNTATGLDDVLVDQDNNVAVSQDLSANNDCDATATNNALCQNFNPINQFESITQVNTALADGFSVISQSNDATINQNIDLLNSCDESGDGDNVAECINSQTTNLIGPIVQINTASGADETDTLSQSNGAQVTQNLQAANDCDEENTGDNLGTCINEIPGVTIDTITQTNDAQAGDDTVQLNFVGMNQDLKLENVCDETGLGDNDEQCSSDTADNLIGPVDQSNGALGSGDADFTQNNNIPVINQVIVAENDCDQADEQSAGGS